MPISRRALLRQLGVSAVTSASIPSLRSTLLPLPSAKPKGVIRLDRNENAYGPGEASLAAMRSALNLSNRYPSLETSDLVKKIASVHYVKPEQVTLGVGSVEILRMAAEAFLTGGKKLVLASPTFDVLARFAAGSGARVAAVPLTATYAHDLDAMLEQADYSTGLIYLCNPNNPTGTLTLRKDLETFLRKLPGKSPVIIDEAYHHYVDASQAYASFIDHQVDDERLIVVRTFSKIYGLAGMRVGYAISSPQLARSLSAHHLEFGVSALGARAATAALDDADHVRLSIKQNTDDRQEFFNQANARMNRWIDSHTNFVMMKGGLPPKQVIEHFQKNKIFLGPLIQQMPNYVRISLGKPEEMLEFWHIWDALPAHPMAM